MSELKIFLLGAPQIQLDGKPVDSLRRKALALLAYLALEGQPVRRDVLAALLWPDYDSERAYAYLRRALWELKDSLGKEWLEADRDTIAFLPGENTWLDVTAYHQWLADCATDEGSKECLQHLKEAVELYRGDFMAGFSLPDSSSFDDWQFFQAEGLRREQMAALEKLSLGYEKQGEMEAGLEFARRWLEMDALNEAAHRRLMTLYAHMGQRSAALRQYEMCVQSLREQIDVEPQPETQTLAEAIRRGELEREQRPKTERRGEPAREPINSGELGERRVAFRRRNFPAELTPFVGRTQEIQEIQALLKEPHARLVTLLGPGGVGKTRLATQVGSQAAIEDDGFLDGAYFVPLAGLSDSDNIPIALAKALDYSRPDDGSQLKHGLLDFLSQKQMLIVLDNFEHLLNDRSASLIVDLVSAAPEIKLLITSRTALSLKGERLYHVSGMRWPETTGNGLTPESALTYSAIRLFVQRARSRQNEFRLTEENLTAVVQICQLVQGLPLAIELAAGWMHLLSPEEIVRELRRGLDFLEAEQRDIPERQRSIRAVFNTSWALLSERERQVFKQLAVFKDGFTREACRQIAGASLRDLASLVNQSLLRHDQGGRYEIHELLRQYAAERMAEDPDEWSELRERHSKYYFDLLYDQGLEMKGLGQQAAFEAVDRDIGNIRTAWIWAVIAERFERLDRALFGFYIYYDWHLWSNEMEVYLDSAIQALEGQQEPTDFQKLMLAKLLVLRSGSYFDWTTSRPVRFNRRALDLVREVGVGEEFGVWYAALAATYGWRVEPEEGIQMLRKSLAYFQERGEAWEVSYVKRSLGALLSQTGRLQEGNQLLEEAAAGSRSLGDRLSLGYALEGLGMNANRMQEHDRADQLLREGQEIFAELGDIVNEGVFLEGRGLNYLSQGRFDQAVEFFRRFGQNIRVRGDRHVLANALSWESIALVRAGDYAQARRVRNECLQLAQEYNDLTGQTWGCFELGEIERISGNYAAARELFERSRQLFDDNRFFHIEPFYQRGMGEIALAQGDLKTARRYFEKGLDASYRHYHFWNAAYVLSCLGRLEILEKNFDTGEQRLRESLATAFKTGDRGLSFLSITGFARLYVSRGEYRQAAALAAFVANHPASWQEYKDRAVEILTEAPNELPGTDFQAATEEGRSWRWEQVVQRFSEN